MVEKDLDGIGHDAARRILRFLRERISSLEDPRDDGPAVKGSNLGDLWRYRIGDYRVIVDLKDDKLLVLVVKGAIPR